MCHLQKLLQAQQVAVSKELALLRRWRLVVATREANWMVYRLVEPVPRLLAANLDLLGEDPQTGPLLAADRDGRALLLEDFSSRPSTPEAVVASCRARVPSLRGRRRVTPS